MLSPVGVTTADYIAALQAGNATHVRLTFTGQNIVLQDNDISSDYGVVINAVMNPDEDLTMGRAISRELSVRFINNSIFRGFNWHDECKVEFGVEISGVTYWVTDGYYTGESPKDIVYSKTLDFVARDRMTKFDVLADNLLANITFPVTISTLYTKLCQFVGISKVSGDENSTIMGYTISTNPFTDGISCRAILAYIAEATCCYAVITNTGEVKLKWYEDHTADYVIDPDYQFNMMTLSDPTYGDGVTWASLEGTTWAELENTTWWEISEFPPSFWVNAASIVNSVGNYEYVYPTSYKGDTNVYHIIDNPLLINSNHFVTILQNAYSRLTGIGYYMPMAVDTIGNWLIETGDVVTVVYGDDSRRITVPIFTRTLTWNGAASDMYECTSNVERPKLTNTEKAVFEENGKMKRLEFLIDGKYDMVNGIVIDEEGVEVTGEKFVRIESGGEFTVNSENFIIDSENKEIQVGSGLIIGENSISMQNGTLDIDSTNFKIDSTNKYMMFETAKISSKGIRLGTHSPDPSITYGAYVGYSDYEYGMYDTDAYASMVINRDIIYLTSGLESSFLFNCKGKNSTATCIRLELIDHSFSSPEEHYGVLYARDNSVLDIGKYDWRIRCVYATDIYGTLHNYSSKEVKHNIKPIHDMGSVLDKLEPVTFVYNDDKDERIRHGLIYEDTVDILPEICTDKNNIKAINYIELVPILLKEIQDLRQRVKLLEERQGI